MENRYKNKLKLSIIFILSIFLGLGMVACSNNKDTSEENITSETSSSEEKGTSEIISGDDSSEEVLSATNNSENTSIEEENSSIEESGVSTEITSEDSSSSNGEIDEPSSSELSSENSSNNSSNEEVSSENFSSDVVSSEENLSEISSDESSEIISSEDVSSEEINEEDSTLSSGNDESSSELPPEIELFEAIYLEETNSYMLTKYNGTEEEIIIPSTFNELEVTHLGDYLFYECMNISKMYIPNTIKYFGESIFNLCYIETLEFDGTLAEWVSIEFGHTISPAVFAKEFYLLNENNEKENYANKKYIEIPDGVTRISSNFLIDFKNAYSITLPSSLDEVYTSYDFYMMAFCVYFDFTPTYEIVNKSDLNLDFLEEYFTNITYSNESKLLIENDFVFIEKEEGYFLIDYVGENLTITLPDSCNDSSYKLHEYSFITNNNIVEVTIPSSIDEISTVFFAYSSSLLKLTIENENINSLQLLLLSPYLEILLPNFDNPNFKNIYIEGPYLNNYSVSKIEDDTNNIIYEEEFVFYKFNNKYILLNYFGDSPNIVLPDDIDGHPYDIYIDAFFINSRNFNIEIPLNVRNISVGGYVNILPNYHILSFYFNGEPTDFIQTSINFPLFDLQNINFYCKNESGEYVNVFDYQIDLETVKEIHLDNCIDTIGNLINLYSSLERVYFHGTLEEWFEINIESIGEYEIIIIDGDQKISLKDIKEIYIKDDKGSIEENDLYYYPSLETIYFEGTIEDWLKMDLDTDLFNSNINIYFKDGEDYIEIKDVVIPESIISLENKNLSLIKTIESVTIGTSLKAIMSYVFEDFNDDLKIYLDMTVEEYVINKLNYNIDREVYLKDENSNWISSNSITEIIIPDKVTEINYGLSLFHNLVNVSITEGVTNIGERAFYNCSSLTSIVIPDSVTSIGRYAFEDCSSLENVYYNGTIEDWCNITFESNDSNPIYYATNLYFLDENGDVEYNGNKYSLLPNELVIPNSVTEIKPYAFSNCSSLTSIVIPEGVTSIGEYAFYNCSSLTSIVIPDSVTSIGDSSFYNCNSLENVYYNGTIEDWCNITFKYYNSNPMNYATNLYFLDENGDVEYNGNKYSLLPNEVVIPNSVTEIKPYAFYNCSSLTSIVIPDSVTSIGDSSFYNCNSLENVYYNGTIEDWCNITFKYYNSNPMNYATNLYFLDENGDVEYNGNKYSLLPNELVIPNSVTEIKPYAFEYCRCLTIIVIPEGVTSIGNYAFSSCSSLTSIVIPNGVTSIESHAFSSCSSLTSIELPSTLESIGTSAFEDCSSLTSITIPETVTSIGYSAFGNCRRLTSIVIPDSVTSIGGSAFYYCSSLTIYCEATSKPSGWDSDWNYSSRPVYWGINETNFIEKDGIQYVIKDNKGIVTRYVGSNTEVEIPSSIELNGTSYDVTGIGDSAFRYCSSLTSIVIPEGVTRIESDAFYFCSSLTSIVIPEGVTSIGNSAFSSCSSLTSIELPSTLESIGTSAFEDCSSLTSIVIPEGVTSIGNYAFEDCSSLTSIVIPNGVTSIESHTFYFCSSLENVYYNGTIEDWYNITFKYYNSNPMNYATNLYFLDENGDVEYNGNKYSLLPNELVIPNSVTEIKSYTFSGCSSLTSIVIPDSVTSIGRYAFEDCSSLENVYYNGTIEDWCNITFESNDSNPIYYATNLYFLDENGDVEYNGNKYSLLPNEVVIPNSVTAIKPYAFYNCSSLTSIVIPDSVTSIGYAAFYNCSSLTSIVIPNGVTSIGDYAFEYCRCLTSIVIPDSVTSIGDYAFYNCSSLISIVIPDSVTSIGGSAFYYCSSLTIYCEATSKPSGWDSDWNYSSRPVYWGINETNFIEKDGIQYVIKDNKGIVTRYVGSNTEVEIPSSIELNGTSYDVTGIGDSAFSNCSSLTSIVIPNSVTSIGNSAFSNCSSLENVYYNGTIEDWCNITFKYYNSNPMNYATNLYFLDENGDVEYNGNKYSLLPNEVVIPNSVTEIKPYAFYNCSSLTSIVIPDSVTSIGDSSFYNCNSLTSITIPESVTSIGYAAFRYCSSLTSIVIPDSVTSIGDYAFYNCSSLTSIVIPDSVTSIGDYAFSYCSSLTIYCETTSQPSGWDSDWNSSNRPVYWANEWEYVNSVPTPIE